MRKKLILLSFLPLLLCSCKGLKHFESPSEFVEIRQKKNNEDNFVFGKEAFQSNPNADFEVIFFDINENISEDGKTRTSSPIGFVSASDCYLIKSGDVEILVDCGIQTYSAADRKTVLNDFLVPKIMSYVEGNIDYILVTHGDSDHLNGINILFDEINKEEITFPNINYLIDFDSKLVRYYNSLYYDENPETWIYNEHAPYHEYVKQRDSLIKSGKIKNYASTSYFFSADKVSENLNKKEKVIEENLNLGMPALTESKREKVQNYIFSIPQSVEELNDVKKVPSYIQYDHSENFDNGNLVNALKGNRDYRLIYNIPLNKKVSLNILYNWYYNHLIKSSFSSPQPCAFDVDGQLTDCSGGTIANNVSMCFSVTSKTCKFVSYGDLGGSGETGLCNYYEGTDVLKGITCFKASHHGSTNNYENYSTLINYGAQIIFVPNVFLKNRHLGLEQTDELYNKLASKPSVVQQFFNNVKTTQNVSIVMANETIGYSEEVNLHFYYTPLYGDIHVSFFKEYADYCYTYCGKVVCYINKEKPSYEFFTYNENQLLSIQDTTWYKEVGYK